MRNFLFLALLFVSAFCGFAFAGDLASLKALDLQTAALISATQTLVEESRVYEKFSDLKDFDTAAVEKALVDKASPNSEVNSGPWKGYSAFGMLMRLRTYNSSQHKIKADLIRKFLAQGADLNQVVHSTFDPTSHITSVDGKTNAMLLFDGSFSPDFYDVIFNEGKLDTTKVNGWKQNVVYLVLDQLALFESKDLPGFKKLLDLGVKQKMPAQVYDRMLQLCDAMLKTPGLNSGYPQFKETEAPAGKRWIAATSEGGSILLDVGAWEKAQALVVEAKTKSVH